MRSRPTVRTGTAVLTLAFSLTACVTACTGGGRPGTASVSTVALPPTPGPSDPDPALGALDPMLASSSRSSSPSSALSSRRTPGSAPGSTPGSARRGPRGATLTATEAAGALLQLSDLPSEWVSRPSPPSTARGTRPARCAPLVSVLSTGRHAARADRLYTAARGVPQLTETLVSYTTPAAATLKPLPPLIRTCSAITQLATNGDLAMTVTGRAFPKVGDRTVAVRLTMVMEGTRYTADLVYVAVGHNALRFNLVTTTPLPDAEVERIVRAGVARLGI